MEGHWNTGNIEVEEMNGVTGATSMYKE